MRRILIAIVAIAAPLEFGAADSLPADGHSQQAEYRRAIELARSGRPDDALEILAELRAAATDDIELLHDETVILIWAGKDSEAIANADLLDRETAPDYVLEAVAKAYRNTGHHAEAVAWYETLLERDPENIDARIGLAFTHADNGNTGIGREILAQAPARTADSSRLALAEAFLYEKQGQFIDALALYQRILESDAGNPAALRGKIMVLRELLLPRDALALAEQHPGLLNETQIAQLKADLAAITIREGAAARYPASRRYEGTDRALARIDDFLADPEIQPEVHRRLRHDRIVALGDRGRHAEAVAAFEALDEPLQNLPIYLINGTASAYLAVHQPRQAERLLNHALNRAPDDIELRIQLVFAYSDLQKYTEALALADELLGEVFNRSTAEAAAEPDRSRIQLRVAIVAGLARAYADQLVEAQQYFERLLNDMPHNTAIRQELATVYRWRGWIDRSLNQFGQVLAVEPNFLAARVGKAHTLLDAREYDEVEHEVEELAEQYGEEPAVQSLARRWRIHNLSEARIDVQFGESSGTTFGEDQYEVNASWYSRPFSNRYRAVVRTHDAFAEFPEGDTRRLRAGLGVEYRYARWRADAGVTVARNGGHAGVNINAEYRLSDHFDLAGRFETESTATPLRGFNAGVSGRLASFSARYARAESMSLGVTGSVQDLSDGNSVRSLFLDGATRVVNRPRFKTFFGANLYKSTRDRDDVAYFSPRHDFSWTAGLRTRWAAYRRHGISVGHSLRLEAGRYDQAGFPAGDIWAADFRLGLDLGQRWYTELGFRRQRGHYDGAPEHASYVVASFGGRF